AIQTTFGQELRFRATVTTASGLPPTGTVTFRLSPFFSRTAEVINGTADLFFPGGNELPAGSYNVTAEFDSDAFDSSISAPITQIVNRLQPSLALVPPANVLTGKSYTLTAAFGSILIPSGNISIPTGLVTFRDGSTVLGSAQIFSDGTARLQVTFTAP